MQVAVGIRVNTLSALPDVSDPELPGPVDNTLLMALNFSMGEVVLPNLDATDETDLAVLIDAYEWTA